MTSQANVPESTLPEEDVQAFIASVKDRAIALAYALSVPTHEGKSKVDVLAEAYVRLGMDQFHPVPFESSSRQDAIQSSNAPETTTTRTETPWIDRLYAVCSLLAGRHVVAVADSRRSLGMKSGPCLLFDVLFGAISTNPEFKLDENGNLPREMSRSMRELYKVGYLKRNYRSTDVPQQRALKEFDDFMAARNAQIQVDGKEWHFGEMCKEADPNSTLIGWKDFLPGRLPTEEADDQPSTPPRRCAEYSYLQYVAIIGRPGQHSACDCPTDKCKFQDNPNQLRIVALGIVICMASQPGGTCSCLPNPVGGGKGVCVRVIKALKHGQTHPEEAQNGRKPTTTKVLLSNASGTPWTTLLRDNADIWCPSRLAHQITEERKNALMPKRGRKTMAKDDADAGEEGPPATEDTLATRRSTRQRTDPRNDDEINQFS
jgi:hypothetical protein